MTNSIVQIFELLSFHEGLLIKQFASEVKVISANLRKRITCFESHFEPPPLDDDFSGNVSPLSVASGHCVLEAKTLSKLLQMRVNLPRPIPH